MPQNMEASEAARALGSIKTEKKTQSSRKSLAEARRSRWTEESKAAHAQKLREAWARRKALKNSLEKSSPAP